MRYTGELLLRKPCPMVVVARWLRMEEIKTFETGDIVGTMQWRGGVILAMLHLSYGDMIYTERIKVYAHHVEETEYDEFWKLVVEMLKDMTIAEIPAKKEIFDYTIKHDGD
jgi:hypothetical protein